MPHSYVVNYVHYIFSTKERVRILTPEVRDRLWPYMCGIAKEHKIQVVKIGCVEDHVHILVNLPSTLTISKAVQLIKGSSSTWARRELPVKQRFGWQEGYGAFGVSVSLIAKTTKYIENQEDHHRLRTFQEEFLEFLKKHKVRYDERYIWD